MWVVYLAFLAGFGVAANVFGWIYWNTIGRMRREDLAWRAEQRQRIDDLQERSERMYEQSRRDLGLPPRIAPN